MNSFDVFDTLIARRLIHHDAVFNIMELKTGIAGLAATRREAEVVAGARGPYSLEQIWHEAVKILGLPDNFIEEMQELEVQTEFEQSIPIAQNLNRVVDGDYLISDMYLNSAVIQKLLKRAGLTAQVRLIVSNNGKLSGRVWHDLERSVRIVQHLGDNRWSDGAIPRSKGISTARTRLHRPTTTELWLRASEIPWLGELAREVRLATCCNDPIGRALQLVQADLNIPLLIVASIELTRWMSAVGRTKAVFCARDCLGWRRIFDAIVARLGLGFTSEYFWVSRVASRLGGDDYIEYARDTLTDRAIVVDLSGSGNGSLAHLVGRLGLSDFPVFFVSRTDIPSENHVDGICSRALLIHTLTGHRSVKGSCEEFANQAPHASVADVVRFEKKPVPIFMPEHRNRLDLERVQIQLDVIEIAARRLSMEIAANINNCSTRDLASLGSSILEKFRHQTALRTFATSNEAESRDARARLGFAENYWIRLIKDVARYSCKIPYRRVRCWIFGVTNRLLLRT